MIQLNNIVKTYILGEQVVKALNGVSLTINEGEMAAITGASGSGKSTMMNILGCLDRPDAGEYFLAGQNVAGMNADELAGVRNRRIGFIFQSFHLLPRMNTLENVCQPLYYQGLSSKEAKEKAMHSLKRVSLDDRMDHLPNQLSGGQRQRVAIARALVANPAILLADEPTGNLDSKTGKQILELFHELHSEGRTIIMVTHDPEIAAICPTCVQMRDGEIVDYRRVVPEK
ncbi:MAG: ABC transporter ATP-binding protein [Candidatus Cloacimonetes bacterium]|nr:ABC transporter ATP-binding protein [Candidatus Cloacimonadota bacterium]